MSKMLQRYKDSERMNHWFIAITFFLATLSGLTLFHPSMYFLSNLFGGGPWTRILHPFIGVAMFLGFLLMFFRLVKDNIITKQDREWRRSFGTMIKGNVHNLPPVAKYNYGQKMVFWLMTLSLLALVITGVMFWRPWFAPYFSIPIMRIAVLIHSISAVVLIFTVIIHIYAAIWVKGTMRAMTRGTVSEAWAKTHHPLWYKKVSGK
ncbi:MAG TPA: formate dehydrogenase subunit gamma [Burkholderiaceae bacterium]|nr:formate dehydrogenase subunit gamma [Burkholderiaceae bacterium]